MTRRSKIWIALAVVFLAVNVFGGIYAFSLGETAHGLVHVALTIAAVIAVRGMARRGRGTPAIAAAGSAASSELGARLSQLEHSMDSVALEIERIGEGQRYVTRLFAERQGAGAAEARAGERPAPDEPAAR